jgi:hypothetical protein
MSTTYLRAVVESALEAQRRHALVPEARDALEKAKAELDDIEWAAKRLYRAGIFFPALVDGERYADGARVLQIIERIASQEPAAAESP